MRFGCREILRCHGPSESSWSWIHSSILMLAVLHLCSQDSHRSYLFLMFNWISGSRSTHNFDFRWSDPSHEPSTGHDISGSDSLLCRLFGISCSEVNDKLVSQIKAWQTNGSCPSAGERCSYEVGKNISGNCWVWINDSLGVYEQEQEHSLQRIHIFISELERIRIMET